MIERLLLTEPVPFTEKGYATFAEAIAIAGTIPDYLGQSDSLIYIGNAQVACEVHAGEAVTRLYELAQNPEGKFQERMYRGIITIERNRGNFKGVEKAVSYVPEVAEELRFKLDLAKSKKHYGVDPSRELAWSRLYVEEKGDEHIFIEGYTELAKAMYHITGTMPYEYLSLAAKDLYDYRKVRHTKPRIPEWYGLVSEAYAFCGAFEEAHFLVDNIQGNNSITDSWTQTETLAFLAQEQMKRMVYAETMGTLTRAINVLDHTDPTPAYLRGYLDRNQTYGKVKLLSLLGKAQGLHGDDAGETFREAHQLVSAIKGGEEWQTEALMEIAQASHEVGVDPAPLFEEALSSLDGISQKPDPTDEAMVAQIFGYEKLAHVETQTGHIEEAYTILDRLQQHPQSENLQESIIQVMADIGRAEMIRSRAVKD